MATNFAQLKSTTSVAADIHSWTQFIEDTLVTVGGWVVTSDTGQTLPSALGTTSVASTKLGYRIYRMADSLQGTYPVFMRIDFGSSQFGSGNSPGIWITIGTGSDGAGNITGKMLDGGASATCTIGAAIPETTPRNSYGSAGPARWTTALFLFSGAINDCIVFGIERTKDLSGNDTGAGLLLIFGGGGTYSSALKQSNYLIYGAPVGSQPASEIALNYVITSRLPSEIFPPGSIGLGVIIHFKGVAQQPGVNFLVTNSSDVSLEGIVNTTIYGVTHSYVQLNVMQVIKRVATTGAAEAQARALMRYD